MKIPLSKLGLVDVDLKTVPKRAWIIFAWALFILSVGLAVAFARYGGIFIKKDMHRTPEAMARAAAALYSK